MPNPASKNILIAPLDWGGGHTTRCMPVISYLRQLGHTPIVAGNATQISIIKDAYNNEIQTVHLDGYNIRYSALNRVLQAGLLYQMPGILSMIKHEHEWLKQAVKEHNLHGVLSDNRYGLHHPSIPTVIMTHQLRVLTGLGGAADTIVQRLHYRELNKFGSTWIVDTEAALGLAGKLSHTEHMPERYSYIGLLSRFATAEVPASQGGGGILVLLSGPEPQRSILSAILWQQAVTHKGGNITFVAGSNDAQIPDNIPAHITYHKRLGNEALLPLLRAADMVICRSGYSTIMDLIALGKKAILLPTPGQTEQEYLGKMLHERGAFYSTTQGGFELDSALKETVTFPYTSIAVTNAYRQFEPVVDEWLQGLSSSH